MKAKVLLLNVFIYLSVVQLFALEYIPVKGNVWHLRIAHSENMGDILVYATYDGCVAAIRLSDWKDIWEYNLGAFPFDLEVSDINGDGSFEVLTVTAEGELFALDALGRELWKYEVDKPLYSVSCGNICGDDIHVVCGGIGNTLSVLSNKGILIDRYKVKGAVINHLVVEDFDNDGVEEILFSENRVVKTLLKYQSGSFVPVWSKQSKAPDMYRNWENPQGNVNTYSLVAGDVNEDGKLEFISGESFHTGQSVFIFNNEGDCLMGLPGIPKLKVYEDGKNTEFYSTAIVALADMDSCVSGPEIVSVAGSTLSIYKNDGSLLKRLDADIGFSDMVIWGDQMFLGSTPNGDNQVYKIDLSGDYEAQFLSLQRCGKILDIEHNLSSLKKKVIDLKSSIGYGKSRKCTYYISPFSNRYGSDSLSINEFEAILAQYPALCIRKVHQNKIMEKDPPLKPDGSLWNEERWKIDTVGRGDKVTTADDIVEMAERIERSGKLTQYIIGHSCMPFITLETAERIMEVAPETCFGFSFSEDEHPDLFNDYFDLYYKRLANACIAHGYKRITTKNKGPWWVFSTTDSIVYNSLFNEGRKNVSLPSTEDSNSRTPELNLLGRAGLYKAGLIDGFIVNTNQDLFSFNRLFQWEYPKSGHPYFRLLVAHTLLGGNFFSMRHPDTYVRKDSILFTQIGKESTEVFLNMLGKGILYQPEPAQMKGFSSLGILFHQPSVKFATDAYNGHNPGVWVDDKELEKAVIPHNGCLWGMTNTPEFALQKVLFNKQRQFGSNIPATPYGLITFLPEQTNTSLVPYVKEWWHTDGIYLWKDERVKYTGEEAAALLRQSAERCASDLIFRTYGDDVFMQVLEITPKEYLIYLIDPGWVNPASRDVSLVYQRNKSIEISDVLGCKDLVMDGSNRIQLKVSAGSLRILRIKEL